MTLCASFILFRGFNTTNAINTISLLCGFLVIFAGVYLLNVSRVDPNGNTLLNGHGADEIPMDNGVAVLPSRRSMQSRRSSLANHTRLANAQVHRAEAALMRDYENEEETLGLTHLDDLMSHGSEESFNGRHND